MNAARLVVGDGVALVALDAAPNTTAPPTDRVFTFPNRGGVATAVWLTAEGGTPTVELWLQANGSPGHWFRWNNSAFAIAQDALQFLALGAFPLDMPGFLRVTVVNGCTRIGGGLTI